MNSSLPTEFVSALEKCLGPENVFKEPSALIHFTRCRESVLKKLGVKVQETMPDLAVTPTSTDHVKTLIELANIYKVPVIPYGATTVLNPWVIPTRGGVAIDFSKMRALTIDRDTMTVTVEPGVLTNELWAAFIDDPELEPWITGGPGQSRVIAQWTFGGIHKTGNFRFGRGYNYIVSVEMVLPDGTVLRTGSSSVPFHKDFWPHGPGPELTYLPVLAHGEYGVVTKMTLKLNYKPAKRDYVMAVFKTKDALYKALAAFSKIENGRAIRGVTVAPHGIIAPYSSEYFEMAQRLKRAMPKLGFLVVAIEGTERTVRYWLNKAREIIEKHGGKVVPKEIVYVYDGYVDNVNNVSIIRSSRIFRKWFLAGRWISGSLHDVEAIEEWEGVLLGLKVPWYKRWYGGLQLYGTQWNHYTFLEYLYSVDFEDPESLPVLNAIPSWDRIRWRYNTGMHGEWKQRATADIFGEYYRLCLRIKRELDPNNIANPGVLFTTS